MTNNYFDINKTNNHTKKNLQHIQLSAVTFTGYTQSQKIVNKKMKYLGPIKPQCLIRVVNRV